MSSGAWGQLSPRRSFAISEGAIPIESLPWPLLRAAAADFCSACD
jgi:hypothetical protein